MAQQGNRSTSQLRPSSQHSRRVRPGWYYGIRQQDAAEFLTILLRLVSPLIWQSRLRQAGDLVQTRDSGLIITLDLSSQQSSLQQLIFDWHGQHSTHALSAEPSLLCIQLGRYPGHQKIARPINLPNTLELPAFIAADTVAVQWLRYSVTSVVIHLGRSPLACHYRALLQSDGAWFYTNDHVRACRTTLQAEHLRGSYVLLLTRAAQ